MNYRKILSNGYLLDNYRIERVLGQGGFGITYLAFDLEQQQYVAIKEYFPKDFSFRNENNTITAIKNQKDVFLIGLKSFVDEAMILAKFDHPNVIKVIKYFEKLRTAYLVMEYCDGNSLNFILKKEKISPKLLLKWFASLLDGLEYLHKYKIIHGDIKPSNIFISSDGRPVLLDFGSAKQSLNMQSSFFVSDHFSATEFYSKNAKKGPFSDIYSLAATFYFLITGKKVPIANERLINDKFVSLNASNAPGYDFNFLSLINKCLDIDFGRRPKNVSEVKSLYGFTTPSHAVKINPDLILGKNNYYNKKIYIGIIISVFMMVFFYLYNNQPLVIVNKDIISTEPPKPFNLDSSDINYKLSRLSEFEPKNIFLLDASNDVEYKSLWQEVAAYITQETWKLSKKNKEVKGDTVIYHDLNLNKISFIVLEGYTSDNCEGENIGIAYICNKKEKSPDFICELKDKNIKIKSRCITAFGF